MKKVLAVLVIALLSVTPTAFGIVIGDGPLSFSSGTGAATTGIYNPPAAGIWADASVNPGEPASCIRVLMPSG